MGDVNVGRLPILLPAQGSTKETCTDLVYEWPPLSWTVSFTVKVWPLVFGSELLMVKIPVDGLNAKRLGFSVAIPLTRAENVSVQ